MTVACQSTSAPDTCPTSLLQWIGSTTLLDAPLIEGNVTGSLPTTVTMNNGTAFNDYLPAAQFGEAFSFVVQFSVNVTPSVLGTSFALALYAADGMTPLLTDDVSGSLVRFELSATGIDYLANSLAVQVTPVPLPAAAWLLLSGMVTLFGAVRRRTR
ncbi:NF038129 family PEP-CTERM protein [Steroidobacter flavus]|uniref:NF038129 family PEP-CTERM protein n=1 Tax=Steroidobacter flavus TaxID=1842136 RepID=A0ABV8T1Y2_9GAMM